MSEPFVMHSMTFKCLLSDHIRAVTFENSGEGLGPCLNGRRIIIDDRAPRNELVEELVNNLENAEYE